MAIVIIKDLARSDIDAIGGKMDGVYEPVPEGLVVQAVTVIDEGERIVEIWESQDHYDRFRNEVHGPRLRAAVAELGDVEFRGALSLSVAEAKRLLVGK